MDKIDGIELRGPLANAEKAFQKTAEGRITDYVRGLMIQEHNLRMKVARLETETALARESASLLQKKLEQIRAGDWSVIEPFEIKGDSDAK
jgi:hypothetical protein